MPTKTISQSELATILRGITHATPVTISAFVDARARKTGNPFREVMKLNQINGFVGASYEASVQRQQSREGSVPAFEARERSWGERISPALVQKDDKLYLAIQPRSTSKPTYFGRDDKGVMIQVKKEVVEPFLPVHRSSAPSQGVEKEIAYRNYGLDSIVAATINKQHYRVRAT